MKFRFASRNSTLVATALFAAMLAAACSTGNSGSDGGTLSPPAVDMSGEWSFVVPALGDLGCSGEIADHFTAADLFCAQGVMELVQSSSSIFGSGGCTGNGEAADFRSIEAVVSGNLVTGRISWLDDCGGQECATSLAFRGTAFIDNGLLLITELTAEGIGGSCQPSGMTIELSRLSSNNGVDLVIRNPNSTMTVDVPVGQAGAFNLSATVRNQGNEPAAASTLRWYISVNSSITGSDFVWLEIAVPALAAGEEYAAVASPAWPDIAPYNTEGQSFWVAALADAEDVVEEGEELNNLGQPFTMSTLTTLDLATVFSDMVVSYEAIINDCNYDSRFDLYGNLAEDGVNLVYVENRGGGDCAAAPAIATGSHIEAGYTDPREFNGCYYDLVVQYSLDMAAGTGNGQGWATVSQVPTAGQCPAGIACTTLYALQLWACDGCTEICAVKGPGGASDAWKPTAAAGR